MRLALVLLGGALGSGARYLAGTWIAERWTGFPWGTLAVNIVGSFLIGLVATAADERGALGANARVFLVAGVLGGFTTFSAFALETWRLGDDGHGLRAAAYVLASVSVSLGAVVAGVAAGRALG